MPIYLGVNFLEKVKYNIITFVLL